MASLTTIYLGSVLSKWVTHLPERAPAPRRATRQALLVLRACRLHARSRPPIDRPMSSARCRFATSAAAPRRRRADAPERTPGTDTARRPKERSRMRAGDFSVFEFRSNRKKLQFAIDCIHFKLPLQIRTVGTSPRWNVDFRLRVEGTLGRLA